MAEGACTQSAEPSWGRRKPFATALRRLGAAGFAVLLVSLTLGALAGSAAANHSTFEHVSAGEINGNGAFRAGFVAASQDGTRVFFQTAEQLVAADTDSGCRDYSTAPLRPCNDVYERSGGTTTLVSTGPAGGNGAFDADFGGANTLFHGASSDGTRVFFETAEQLVAADTDSGCLDYHYAPVAPCNDVYERSGGTTTLVSTGPAGGNGAFYADFAFVSQDGTRVFFETFEQLVATDTDSCLDLYQRSGDTTTLVSTGPTSGSTCPSPGLGTNTLFRGASSDGTRVFFQTNEQLVAADTDSCGDLYERSGDTTTLISTGPLGDPTICDAPPWRPFQVFAGASSDGTRVFFVTSEPLVAADTDSRRDIYERSGGNTTLVSTGPGGGNGAFDVYGGGSPSSDGTRVFFQTFEQLVAADTDSSGDIYERSGGTTTLVSTGPAGGNGAFGASFARASSDGTRVFFLTREQLVAIDTDSACRDYDTAPLRPCNDVYERAGGTTTLVSTGSAGGNGAFDAHFAGFSSDGRRVFFGTAESLVAADSDDCPYPTPYVDEETITPWEVGCYDVYERFANATTLISTGPAGGNGAFHVRGGSPSQDGTRVFFQTFEQLVAADTDSSEDIYMAAVPEPRREDFQNGPAYCRALRDHLGAAGFASRFGGRANAFGKCVSRK